MESIADQSLKALASAIASRAPAPGSGVAAAAALALGIACARKAAAITLKHNPDRPGIDTNDARLAELQDTALRLAETDASCFPAAIRDDERAAARLIEGDKRLLACADEAEEIVARLAVQIDEVMRNDILAARALIEAAAAIVRANLAENEAAQSSGNSRSEADR
ncbi:cyclodeaminase/cyclohydrolase family protein [Sphingomonas sp.]|jgi:formiminotetrahydrofolate cyclodeaminase|uniref:cyclodeaminase/cyclohydrolase family protein n=1 Tax=Sphingomonas sp. TaxID=28214 RepID=UPI002DEAFC80|nr:cyclodeaminase/cyclohydrolase family protein [Sphingomonas sp.]HEV2568979.1 cyclodeaminase/cyclohydrolase family protein [Sphingomonas sp.]